MNGELLLAPTPAPRIQSLSLDARHALTRSAGAWASLGRGCQCVESFVTDDRIYCVYLAPDEATVREHASLGGFPANSVARVRAMINPTTAE